MLQAQADISSLSARALGRWSAIGYSVKSGRLEVFIPDIPQHIEVKRLGGGKLPDLKPGDGHVDLKPGDGKPGIGGRRGRSIGAARSGVVEFWFPGDKKPHFRCPPGTRRAGKWTDEMGTDCNLGGARAMLSRIGQRLERMAQGEPGRGDLPSVGRRLEAAKERAASKLDYDDPRNTLAAIEEQKRAKKIAKELEKAKKAKFDGSKKPQRKPRVTPPTSQEDADNIRKALEEKLKPYGKPGRELTDAELEKLKEDALIKRKPGFSEAALEEWASKLDYDDPDNKLKPKAPKKPRKKRDMAATLEAAASKLDYDDPQNALKPKKKRKGKGKRTDVADKLDEAAGALDYNDPSNALKPEKPKDEGELPKPKRTLLQRLKDRKNRKKSPKATAMEAVSEDAATRPGKAPTPEVPADVVPEAPKKPKKPKAAKAGQQYGKAFSNEKNVKAKAMGLALDEGKSIYVVQDDQGKFRIMDEERFLATEGATPYAIFGPDGQLVELPEMADDAPDEIVDDVQKIVEAIPDDLAADAKALDVPKGDTTLELSKTGAFLPPDLTPEMLQGQGLDDGFMEAFEKQRTEIRDYWGGRVDLDKADSFDEALQLIDGHIAARKKDGASQKELGQLRAERKNFLAAWMPDEDGEVDPYARVNFLQPKRRTALIEEAGLGDMVVGKKAAKKKVDVPDEQTPDLPAFGQADVEPEGDKWATQLRAIEVEKKAEYDKNVELLEQYFDDAGSELPIDYLEKMLENNDSVLEAYKSSYDANPDAALMEVHKNDLALILARRKVINDRIAKLKGETPEDVAPDEVATPEPDVPNIKKPMSMLPVQWHEAIKQDTKDAVEAKRKEFKDSPDVPQLDEFKNDDGTYDHEQIAGVVAKIDDDYWTLTEKFADQEDLSDADYEAYVQIAAEREHIKDLELEAIIQTEEANAAKAIETVDFVEPATPNADKTPDEIYSAIAERVVDTPAVKDTVDSLYTSTTAGWSETMTPEQVKDAHLKAAELYLAQADQRKLMLMEDLENWGTEPADYDVEAEQQYRQLAKRMLEEAAKIDADAASGTAADKAQASEAHAISAVFGKNPITNSSGTEIFDPQKLIDYETQKFSGDLTNAQARAAKGDDKYKMIQVVIGQSNFSSLTPQEQRAKLRDALGAKDDYELAKMVGRAYATQQYGTKDSLDALSAAATNFSVAGEPDVDKMAAAATAADEARQRLAAAEARLALLTPDDGPITKMIIEADIQDARVQLATHLMTQLKHADVANLVGTDETNEDYLDKIGTAFSSLDDITNQSQKLSFMLHSAGVGNIGGMDLKSHKPKKSADGMPDIADDFDASLLGSIGGADGKAIAASVPIGNKGIYSKKQAVAHVAKGGKLSDVPDEHLKDAIWDNTGPGKRFQVIQDGSIISGFNDHGAETRDKTTGFVDLVTGKQYVLKSPHRNDQEYVQELAGARVQQILGIPAPGMRIAGPIEMKPDKDGNMAPQAPILMEHVGNLFGAEALEDVTGDLNPDSFARMVVLDRVFNYYDRTPANFVAVTMPDGTVHYHPIDHGNAFYPFPGGPQAEEAVGFLTTAKGDNIVPGQIARSEFTTPEQQRAYALSMVEVIREYKRTDWKKTFKEIADRQNLSDDARKKLDQHAEFLEARKEELDWDTMTQTALLDLGLSASEIEGIVGEVDAKYATYAPPADAPTLADAGQKAAGQQAFNLGTFFSYDGEDIEDFSVSTQRTQIVGGMKVGADSYTGDGTTLTFKLHGEAKGYQPSAADGWELLTPGHPIPLQTQYSNPNIDDEASWDFDSPLVRNGVPTYAIGSNYTELPQADEVSANQHKVETWAKRMPDGTIVMVTRPRAMQEKNALVGTVRIVTPGKPEEVLADPARIEQYMSAAGVRSHSQPSSMEFEQSAIHKLGRMLLGSRSDDMSYDELVEAMADKGYSVDDLVVTKLPNGKVQLGLTAEATQRYIDDSGVQWYTHSVGWGDQKQKITEILTAGAISSSTTRYNNGVQRAGLSSAADVSVYGSGDYVFTHPVTQAMINSSENDHVKKPDATYRVYIAPEAVVSRTDWYATPHDQYGEIEGRQPPLDPKVIQPKYGQTPPEVGIKGQVSLADAVIGVPDAETRDEIIGTMNSRGITEIDGVPLEQIVVLSSEVQTALAAARQRVQDRLQ